MGGATDLVARSCPSGGWELLAWRPERERELPGVRRYRGFRLERTLPGRHLMLSDRVHLVFGFEGRVRFSDALTGLRYVPHANPSDPIVVGPYAQALVVDLDARVSGLTVALDPWVAYGMFGVPMHLLANSVRRAADVIGSDLPTLAELSEWPERFTALEEFLVERAARGKTYSPSVVRAVEELCRTGGRIPIERLASDVGWCRRNLARQFREQIGLSPKAFARLLRLRRACRLLERGLAIGQVAELCGYYDRAHLVHDVKRLTGKSPRELFARDRHRSTQLAERCPPVLAGMLG